MPTSQTSRGPSFRGRQMLKLIAGALARPQRYDALSVEREGSDSSFNVRFFKF